MTSITFHGGVNDIGGNKFLVEDKGTRILMDFGMSFGDEGKFFSQFMGARTSNSLADYFALSILPNIPGMYRTDYTKHMELGGDEETTIDAVLLTHAHVDHCKYISYLRPEIPIYCSEASKLIMKNYDDTGTDQYLTHKEKFEVYTNRNGELSKKQGDDVKIARDIQVFEDGKEFSIDSIDVEPMPVDHSIPGVDAFILHTSSGSIANTGDLRFHGRHSDDTEKFVQQCAESDLDLLLCEGTRVNAAASLTEFDVERKVAQIINDTKGLVICGYPIRDLDRLMSFYIAAKNTNRYLLIDMKQAYLLKLFNESPNLKGQFPSPTDKNIKVYIQRGSWGLIDKDLETFTERQLLQDYGTWQREFLDYPNAVVRKAIRSETAQQMVEALITVVSPSGTAKQAWLKNYVVAGKTGTAQKVSKVRRGYDPGKYFSSFIGFLPARKPELCIGVFVDEPQNGYYGGLVAGPAFKEIAEKSANYLGVESLSPPESLVNSKAELVSR